MVYILTFVILNLTFMFTGQITRMQTVIFLLGSNPVHIWIIVFTIIGILILLFIKFIHKKTVIQDTNIKERNILRLFFFFSLVLLIVSILTNIYFFKLENPIITDKNKLILHYESQPVLNQKLSRINQKYDGYNVVFILLESISAERVGVYGYERNTTPNIDKLANESIIFKNVYSISPHSDYAQPGILSSRYILTNDLRTSFDQKDIPRKFMWDVFKENNYTTAYISSQDDKWQGMDKYINYENLDFVSYSRTDGEIDYGSGLAQKDFDHKTANLALRWLNQTVNNNKNPFFLYMNFQSTHLPNPYPEEFSIYKPDDMLHESNRYDNSLTYVDVQVGKIIEFIENNSLKNNTIIVITADHGHDLLTRHGISGHGFSLYDEELKVPMVAYIPNATPIVVDDVVSHIDVVPTLVDLMGYKIPYEFQGDIMRIGRPIIFFTQNHKYMIGKLENNIKTIVDLNRNLIEVYNLTSDPEELENLGYKKYQSDIIKLMFWHYCQLDYYGNARWELLNRTNNRCLINNNFKI